MLGNALAKLHEDEPVPTRIEAAAILRAYSEKAVPLPVQVAAQWYGLGGRYWVLVWLVCGWKAEGDKFFGDNNLAWGMPLSVDDAEFFWSEVGELARASDEWALADGRDVSPPKVDVATLLNRKIDWKSTLLKPIWDKKRASSTALVNFLREAYKQLQEWRKKRQVPAPLKPLLPQPKSGGGGGVALILALLAVLAGARSPSRRRRR